MRSTANTLGAVDIDATISCALDRGERGSGGLFVAGCDAAKVFGFVQDALGTAGSNAVRKFSKLAAGETTGSSFAPCKSSWLTFG